MSEPVTPSSGPTSLEGLLAAVASGDQGAFADLYDRVAGLAYGIVRKVVRDPAQSEEVTQDVMLDIWRTAWRYDAERGAAKAWIASIAHGRAVDLVRSIQSSRDRAEAYGRRDMATEPFDSVVEETITATEHQDVRNALAALTPLQRQVIEMAYYGAMTHREVAEQLDTPLGTVKTRMRDATIRLRAVLGDAS